MLQTFIPRSVPVSGCIRPCRSSTPRVAGLAVVAVVLLAGGRLCAADRDRIQDTDYTRTVAITFSGTTANVADGAGVTVVHGATTSAVSITSTLEGVEYFISGTTTSGYVQITTTHEAKVTLSGAVITSTDGPALSIFSSARSHLVLAGGTQNVLADGSSYGRTGSGTLHTSGPLIFSGRGALRVTGVKSHAIYGAAYVRCLGGDIVVPAATKDAIHSKTAFRMDAGTLDLTATGDGIDGDSGTVALNGGSINIRSTVDDTKGIACDGDLAINGGNISIEVKGTRSKGFSTNGSLAMSGGVVAMNLSGGVYLETVTATTTYVDPSYCSGMKVDGDVAISGGTLSITHTGLAGKGISVDGNVSITGGLIDIATSGGTSSSYTNEDGALDLAAADCLKADGNLTITGGTITAQSSGSGGDAISCDGVAVIGTLGNDTTPVITARTSGARVYLSGSGQNADYVNSKAFKSEGNLTMNGGIYRATTSTEGGEGLESKAELTINGGVVEITSYDDAINAATSLTVNGGSIYCYSTNNDGIDSNGKFRFTGGIILSSGTTSPEEGFDCDNNEFAITGGVVIGTGGATSTPTTASSTQNVVIYKGAATADVVMVLKNSVGTNLVYRLPRTLSSMTMLISLPSIALNTEYTLVRGATVSGGTEFHGYITGATVTGGTTLRTFTPVLRVTTVQ